jgi:hypothetical protein
MLRALNRRVLTLALIAGVLLTAAGTALAAANTLHFKVGQVTANATYAVTVSGATSGNKRLYLFIDSRTCARNPAVEFARTGPFGSAYGYYWAHVNGHFSHTARFRTTAVMRNHACAYLTTTSVRKNSRHGVIAHHFKTYQVG